MPVLATGAIPHPMNKTLNLLIFGAVLLAPALSARAQAPEIGGLLPAGGPRGQATVVRIDGKSLAGAKLHLSGSGVALRFVEVAKGGDGITAEMSVEPGAA